MFVEISIDKIELEEKYNSGWTQKQLGEYFNCSSATIANRMKQYNIIRRTGRTNPVILPTSKQIEVLNGCLLGDGCITGGNIGEKRFQYQSSSKQHVDFVESYLNNYSTPKGVFERKIEDRRLELGFDGIYTRYDYYTINNITFTDFRNKWYPDGIKIIPDDLILTSLTCLLWYIGDGGFISNGKRDSQTIEFCTDSFSNEDLENILLPQLYDFSARIRFVSDKKVWRIQIPHKKIHDFLDYIGDCPFLEYSHKWNYREYKRSIWRNK